jgi:hypothetical protein
MELANGYTNIPDWMLSLDLDVYETIILAVIYGFSQDGESTFSGSLKFLCKKAKCSRRKVTMVLPKLVEMGLIIKIDKEVRGVHLCEYRVSPSCMGGACDAPGGSACDAPNNIEIDNIDINTLSIKRRSGFKKPSLEEIRSYCISRGNKVDPEQFYDFYESNGWMVGKSHMKNWMAAVRTWEKRSQEKPKGKAGRSSRSVFEHNLGVMDSLYGTDLHGQVYGKEVVADEQ